MSSASAAERLLAIGALWQTDNAGLLASHRAARASGMDWIGTAACTVSGAGGKTEDVTGILVHPPSFIERQIDAACKIGVIGSVVVGTLGRHQMVSAVTERMVRRGLRNIVLASRLNSAGRRTFMTQPGVRRLRTETLRMTRAIVMDSASLSALVPEKSPQNWAFEAGVECIISLCETGITLMDRQGVVEEERAFEQVPDNDYVGTLVAAWLARGGQPGREMLASISGDLER